MKVRISNLLRITLMFVLVSIVLVGQSQQQVGSVKVSELSDQQIRRFMEQAEKSGYTEAQLEMLARARGMSATDLSELRSRINAIQNHSESGSNVDGYDRLRSNGDDIFTQSSVGSFDPFDSFYPSNPVEKVNGLPIFGDSFFKNNSIFKPNLNVPTPADYLLGAGDELIIDVWGASEQSYQLKISPEGTVLIPNIGPVYLNGYSIEKAEARIKSRLKSIYSTLGDSTFAQVSLGELKTITISVVGEVNRPGSYPVSSFASVLTALTAAGGPSHTGTFRKIRIFRNGNLVKEADVYDFLIKGTGDQFRLQDQDIVMIPTYTTRVLIDGAVKRPGAYELKDGESLAELLIYAGDFAENAYRKSTSLRRALDNAHTVRTIEIEQYDSFIPQNGDEVNVGLIQEHYTRRVRVEGAVNHPGEFEIKDGMKLSEALEVAEGLRGDAYMERALVIRELANFELQTIAFSPNKLVDGSFDLELEEDDLVKVKSLFDLREKYRVTIQGEVQNPGSYPYTQGMVVEDLIYLAGGFKESAASSFAELARRNRDTSEVSNKLVQLISLPIDASLSLNESDANTVLDPFDVVVIRRSATYEKQTIIEIEGEVIHPGKYALQYRNERISDLLKRAGGVTDFAYFKGASLIRRTEYYVHPDEDLNDDTSEAARIRREALKEVFKYDSSLDKGSQKFKMQESIGIDLKGILNNPRGDQDLILQEGDIISIPQELQTVRVRGEVLYPSTLGFKNGYHLREVIAGAGGFTSEALKRKVYVIYANGSAKRTSSFLGIKKYPKIEPGCELIIPTKTERRRVTPQEILGLSSSVLSMVLIIDRLTN